MNDVSDGFGIFNVSDLEFPFEQSRCYPFHIITFFANFVDVRLIVGLLIGFALGRFRLEVVISRLHDLIFEVRYRITKPKEPPDKVIPSSAFLPWYQLIGVCFVATMNLKFMHLAIRNQDLEFGISPFSQEFNFQLSNPRIASEGDIIADCCVTNENSIRVDFTACSWPLHFAVEYEACDCFFKHFGCRKQPPSSTRIA